MNTGLYFTYRKAKSAAMMSLTLLCALATLVPLFWILYYLVSQGLSSVNLDFFTKLPKPVGEAGGGAAGRTGRGA